MLHNIFSKIATIEHIPSQPSIKKKFSTINTAHSESAQKQEHIHFAGFDPALTFELLKIANTEAFGFCQKISSLEKAAGLLDIDLLKLVIDQHPVLPAIKEFDKECEQVLSLLIKHAIEVKHIAELGFLQGNFPLNDTTVDEITTAATLHDLGLVFLLIYFPNEYKELIRFTASDTDSSAVVEDLPNLPDHALLSALLCNNAQLPKKIVSAVAFHHWPWESPSPSRPIAELLYIADNLSPVFYEIYAPNSLYSIEEHLIMRKNLINIAESLGLEVMDLARIRIEAAKKTEEIFRELDLQ